MRFFITLKFTDGTVWEFFVPRMYPARKIREWRSEIEAGRLLFAEIEEVAA